MLVAATIALGLSLDGATRSADLAVSASPGTYHSLTTQPDGTLIAESQIEPTPENRTGFSRDVARFEDIALAGMRVTIDEGRLVALFDWRLPELPEDDPRIPDQDSEIVVALNEHAQR